MNTFKNKHNIAIFVNTFDGYSDLWEIFWDIFDKYWPDCPCPKYLVSNELNFERDGIINIRTGKEINWFDRTIKAVEHINEEYFILFLEDYFISKCIHLEDVSDIVDKMKTDDIFFYRLSIRNGLPINQSFIKVPENSEYPITLQLGIWRKDVFLKIINELHEVGCKSPWDFEIYLKKNYKYCPAKKGILCGIRFDTRDLFGYKNGVLRGKWFPNVRKYYIRRGIDFSNSNRDIMSFYQNLRYEIINFISFNFSPENKLKLKNFLSKLKIKNTI